MQTQTQCLCISLSGTYPRLSQLTHCHVVTVTLHRTPIEAVKEGMELAEYVSSHPSMPSAINLEFERVLCPLLLDNVNRYAGAEYTSIHHIPPTVHVKVIQHA